MVFKSNNINNFCPVVAQPGRASGCSCWLKMADRKTAYQAYRNRVVACSIHARGTTNFLENKNNKKIDCLRKHR